METALLLITVLVILVGQENDCSTPQYAHKPVKMVEACSSPNNCACNYWLDRCMSATHQYAHQPV